MFVTFFHAAGSVQPFGNHPDHTMRCFRIDFGGIGAFQTADVPGELDRRGLHAVTDTEIGNAVLARKPNCVDFSLEAALAKSAGYQNGIGVFQI